LYGVAVLSVGAAAWAFGQLLRRYQVPGGALPAVRFGAGPDVLGPPPGLLRQLALALGEGSQLLQPLAIAVIGIVLLGVMPAPFADLAQARADLRTAESALEAARNRLAILGKTDAEISAFQQQGKISSETPIYAPLSGTVVQRKIGPGQYVSYTSTGAVDPVFLIGDLSAVWLVAYIRETDAGKVHIGQPLDFTVLSYPERPYRANSSYVAEVLDSSIRRLLVRATIPNGDLLLKPEMFANVRIITDEGDAYPALPRHSSIYERDTARVWVVRDDKSVEMRQVKLGVTNGTFVQVLDGVRVGETVITKGNLFIDRAATGT